MNNSFEYIDEYLDNTLDAAQRSAFEAALRSDPKLAHAVKNHHLLKSLSASLIEDEVREKLTALQSEKERSNLNLFSRRHALAYAAVLFAVFAGGYLLIKFWSQQNREKEILATLVVRPDSNITRSVKVYALPYDQAVNLYNLNRFEEAMAVFNTLPPSDSVIWYSGHTLLLNKNYREAANSFSQLSGNPKYGTPAKYHLLIAYLCLGDKTQARSVFQEIEKLAFLSNEQNLYIIKALDH